jgi:hypothetical protein
MTLNDDLGPLLIAPSSYFVVRSRIREAMGFPNDRRPLLIGIDGVDGSGKSSLAAWLSWQHEMPAIHLDIYVVRDSEPLAWRFDDLARALEGTQLWSQKRPVIVEGVLLLDALRKIGRTPDFLVFVEKDRHEACLRERLESYFSSYSPKNRANYLLNWSSADHDARVLQAHHACRSQPECP